MASWAVMIVSFVEEKRGVRTYVCADIIFTRPSPAMAGGNCYLSASPAVRRDRSMLVKPLFWYVEGTNEVRMRYDPVWSVVAAKYKY